MNRLGIIGGSGVYNLQGLKKKKRLSLKTPFGRPSSEYTISQLEGKEVVFLPRHGSGHTINPSLINYRANIYGMKKLGVNKILSVSASGSLKESIQPLDFVIPDQFIDRTYKRKNTFFEKGIVAHVALANPVCSNLTEMLSRAIKPLGLECHFGGTYLNMEGPQFSTKAESNMYRAWGADIIGMTNFSEARLAREAEICYLSLASVTDYDCWHPEFEKVDVKTVMKNMEQNSQNAKKIIKNFILAVELESACSCHNALTNAIVTRPEKIKKNLKHKLKLIAGEYFK